MLHPAIKAEADAGEGRLGQGPPRRGQQHRGVEDASRTAFGIPREDIEDPEGAAGSESGDDDAAATGPRGSHGGEPKRGGTGSTAAGRGNPQLGLEVSSSAGAEGSGGPVGALRKLLSQAAAAWPLQQQQGVEILKELSR